MTEPIETDVPGLYVLPLPTPFPIGRINTYLVRDRGLTLIDAGVNSERSYHALRDGLALLGIRPADLERIIITHHHTDHIGLVDRLAAVSGAEIWCHAECVPYVEQPSETRQRLNEWSMEAWREAGAPADLITLTAQLMQWFESLGNGSVAVDHVLADGDRVDLLGREWQVLHTPGHAGDLICLYEPRDAVLLSSDHLLRDVSSNALVEPPARPGEKRPRRLLEYMAQLERVMQLQPRIAYGGHGQPTTDVRGVIQARLAFHKKRAQHILELFSAESLTLFEMTEMLFAHVDGPEKYLAMSEVLGHLDWLEQDSLIARVPVDDAIVRWQRVAHT